MSPEEKELLRRTLVLSEENNKILQKLQGHMRWQAFWSVIKILLVVVPLILGYVFLQPYLGSALNNYQEIQGMLQNPENPDTTTSTPTLDKASIQKYLKGL
ncbi:MAG: hypothetical protein JWN89_270 [Parcubacteria group bacterium]|nr:hypothetical protein [Parcubacteria group bacterium]